MIHKGIHYSVATTVEQPDVWQWQFQVGDSIRTGKTKTRLPALAARRVQIKINAALKASSPVHANRVDISAGLR